MIARARIVDRSFRCTSLPDCCAAGFALGTWNSVMGCDACGRARVRPRADEFQARFQTAPIGKGAFNRRNQQRGRLVYRAKQDMLIAAAAVHVPVIGIVISRQTACEFYGRHIGVQRFALI